MGIQLGMAFTHKNGDDLGMVHGTGIIGFGTTKKNRDQLTTTMISRVDIKKIENLQSQNGDLTNEFMGN